MSRPLFADPKTDLVFHRIFGNAAKPQALLGLLNALLELDEAHQIVEVSILTPEQRPPIEALKFSIVDVKCKDVRGTTYVVEMQLLQGKSFERRVFYNAAKAYVTQLEEGEDYPALNDVIGLNICNFLLGFSRPKKQRKHLPMLTRFRMQEQHCGELAMNDVQFVFLELPKYPAGEQPQTLIEKWAYFFKEASNLQIVPDALNEPGLKEAMELAKSSAFTPEEWDAYIRQGMAIEFERTREEYVAEINRKEGQLEGKQEGLFTAIEVLCEVFAIERTDAQKQSHQSLSVEALQQLLASLRKERRLP